MGASDSTLPAIPYRHAFVRLQSEQAAMDLALRAQRAELAAVQRHLRRLSAELDRARHDIRMLRNPARVKSATMAQIARHDGAGSDGLGLCSPQLAVLRRQVASDFDVSEALLCGPRKFLPLVVARREFAVRAAAVGASHAAIGLALGCRDHTTVSAMLKRARVVAPLAGQVAP